MIELVQPPAALDLAATAAGGLTGGLFAVSRGIPATGLLAVTVANAFGGGVLRDLLLGRTPPVALQEPRYLVVAAACAAVCFFLGAVVARMQRLVDLVDAVGTALFAVVGASTALAAGVAPVPAVLIGATNAIGGGVLRDVIGGVTPDISRPGPISGFAGVVTAVAYVVGRRGVDLPVPAALWVAVVLGVALRMLGVWRGTHAPAPVDLTLPLRARVRRTLPPGRSPLGAGLPPRIRDLRRRRGGSTRRP
ncbi:MAG: TRIC cation channel family protein [Kineosporiaceae bacterium]